MTDTYKILGQALTGELAIDNSTVKDTIVYEVPSGAQTSVSAIEITNSDFISQTYNIAFVPVSDISMAIANVTRQEVVGTRQVGTPTVVGTETIIIGSTSTSFAVEGTAGPQFAISSNNGATWTIKTFPAAGRLISSNGVTILDTDINNMYGHVIFTSTDLENWQIGYTAPRMYPIVFGNGKFATVTNVKDVLYSSNGIDWYQSSSPLYYIVALDYVNGNFFIRGDDYQGQKVMYKSSDFTSWTQANFSYGVSNIISGFPYGSDPSPLKIVHNGSRYMGAFNTDNYYGPQLYTSLDGITWQAPYAPTPLNIMNIYNFGQFTFLEAIPGKFMFGVAYSYDSGLNGIWETDGISYTYGPSSLIKEEYVMSMMNQYPSSLNLVSDYGFSFYADMTARPFPSINGTYIYNVQSIDQGTSSISGLTFVAQDLSDGGNGNGNGPVTATFYLADGPNASAQAKADLAAWVNSIKNSGYSYSELAFNFNYQSAIVGSAASRVFGGYLYLVTEYFSGGWYTYKLDGVSNIYPLNTPPMNYGTPYWGSAVDVDPIYGQQSIIETVYTTEDVMGTVSYPIPRSLNKNVAIYNKTILPGETHEIKGGITLSSGDQVRAYSTSEKIIVNVYGAEIV